MWMCGSNDITNGIKWQQQRRELKNKVSCIDNTHNERKMEKVKKSLTLGIDYEEEDVQIKLGELRKYNIISMVSIQMIEIESTG